MTHYDPPADSASSGGFRAPSLALAFLAPLFLVPAISGLAGSLFIWKGVGDLMEEVVSFDQNYDPITIEGGEVSAGPRIVHETDSGNTVLIDPDETVPLEDIHTREYVVIRRTELIQRNNGRETRYKIADLQDFFGVDPLVLDSANIQQLLEDYRGTISAGMGLFFAVVSLFSLPSLALYSALAALPVWLIFSDRGASYLPVFGTAFLVGVVTYPMDWALTFASMDMGLLGLVVWPGLIAALTFLMVALRMKER